MHHEAGFLTQQKFQRNVEQLFQSVSTMANPFMDDFPELVAMGSRNCVDDSVKLSLDTLEELGRSQYNEYCTSVINSRVMSVHEPIRRNSLVLFANPKRKIVSKQRQKFKIFQNNAALFGQLYVAM